MLGKYIPAPLLDQGLTPGPSRTLPQMMHEKMEGMGALHHSRGVQVPAARPATCPPAYFA